MVFRQTTGAALFFFLVGCGEPTLSQVESREVVRAALGPCDQAFTHLEARLGTAQRAGAYALARIAESNCAGATLDLMKARLPSRVMEPCRDASEAGRLAANLAETSLNSSKPGDKVRLQTMIEAAGGQRGLCDSAIGVET